MTRQHQARWYVYQLVDPITQVPFYVGKGTGKRMYVHEVEAAKGVCSRKTRKINELLSLGVGVEKRQVAFFWDEQAAYDHETDLISEIGLHALTNVMPGGQKAWVKRKEQLADRRKKAKPFSLVGWIASCPDAVVSRVAEWLRVGGSDGARIFHQGDSSFFSAVTLGVYNTLFPMLWRMVAADKAAQIALSERLKPYGVELSYGGA